MIIEFRVQNHRSFRKEQTLSFAASNYDKSLPENLITPQLPGVPDLRLIKAAALYGPNAGGKTNLLSALEFLKWLVVNSAARQTPEAKLPAQPFQLDRQSTDQPTVLELTFVVEHVRYELAVAVTSERVVQERLVAYPNGRSQTWYDRVWNEEVQQYDWSQAQQVDFERDPGIMAKTRENALFLSTAAQWNNPQISPVYRWFAEKLRFLNLGAPFPLLHHVTAQMVGRSGDARKLVTSVLRSADLGLADVEAMEQDLEAKMQKFFGVMRSVGLEAGIPPNLLQERPWQVTFRHEGQGGESFAVNWAEESAGTRRFFSVLGPWISVGQKGQVLCVDELDTSLHPLLVAELLRLFFKSTEKNPGAQLLFTTHNPLLLDTALLRRDQVWFADKDREGASFLYPLTDYKPRVDESLVRGYLSGRYGAVPFIPKGLIAEAPAKDDQTSVAPEVADVR